MPRNIHGYRGLLGGKLRFDDKKIDPALGQGMDHALVGFAHIRVGNAEIRIACVGFNRAGGWADGTAHIHLAFAFFNGAARVLGRQARQVLRVCVARICHRQVQGRRDKGVRADGICARVDVRAMHIDHRARMRQVGYRAVREMHAARKQLRPKSPVVEHGAVVCEARCKRHYTTILLN